MSMAYVLEVTFILLFRKVDLYFRRNATSWWVFVLSLVNELYCRGDYQRYYGADVNCSGSGFCGAKKRFFALHDCSKKLRSSPLAVIVRTLVTRADVVILHLTGG